MIDPCHPIRHFAHRVARRVRRHVIRHVTGYGVAAVAVGCAGAPLVAMLAPWPVAPSYEAPVHVPEPASLAVFGVGVLAMVAVRR